MMMMTCVGVVASYPSRRRRQRTSVRYIFPGGGGRRRWFNHRHLVSRLTCGAETTLKGRYLNHFFVSHTKCCFLLSSRVYKRVKKCGKERKKKENEEREKFYQREKLGFRNRRSDQISLLLFYCLTAFQTKVFQRCCCCSNTPAQQHVKVV